MSIQTMIKALKIGESLPNVTKWKWSGVVVLAFLVLIQIGRVTGVVPPEINDESVVEFIGAIYALYIQLATTEKIGL